MRILRVFNNNVVLAARDNAGATGEPTEVVLTGRGLGFQARPGDEVDHTRVVRTFVPDPGRDSDHLAAMAAAVPADYLELAAELAEQAAADTQLGVRLGAGAVFALADHLHMAVRRAAATNPSAQPLDHPLASEVRHLYPRELAVATQMLTYTNAWLPAGTHLADAEAVAIALHLVNAGFAAGDLRVTYAMTGVFSQLFDVIEQALDIQVDRADLSAARFITHMRCFFARAARGEQLDEGMGMLADALALTRPRAVACAARLAEILQLRLGVELTADERSYLALHVARLGGEDAST
ncbi:PRD domain-containing protein [Corynebacterium uberis]|uniref:PRD domain-containing protein n=1 Tax=Corynebacterium uberis TaxID=2883169 RepID=UPI001D0B15C4|nr:PRD domain-containing protein [Corynebacterium uberis]UDL75395.1 PRD domain-containing protein [Corynebacterium uberis]UDL79893.1 PRD domain-containing protein [Corynebacterium uberis]